MGLLVFVLSAIAIVCVVLIFVPLPIPNFEILRSIELLLTLAGTSVILAFMASHKNPVTTIFDLLIIGALIVPSNDLVRFAIIASGSDRKYADLFTSSNVGKSQINRNLQVASQIIETLARMDALKEPNQNRGAVVQMISGILEREQKNATSGSNPIPRSLSTA